MQQIIIQFILCFSILIAIYKVLSQYNSARSKAIVKLLFIGFLSLGLVVIIKPDLANNIAQLVGVQRGADLMLYCLVVAFIFDKINQHYKDQLDKERFARLVRNIALSNTDKE